MAHIARISPTSEAIIQDLIKQNRQIRMVIIEEAPESYRFRKRMRLFNESYERLRTDKKAWADELADREELELEGTLMDGLEVGTFRYLYFG
jgi:hypothetical protein